MKILRVISSTNPKGGGPIEGIKQFTEYNKASKNNVEILCSDNENSPWLKDKRLPKVHALGPKILGYAYNLKLMKWLTKKHSVLFEFFEVYAHNLKFPGGKTQPLHKCSWGALFIPPPLRGSGTC